jgi:hypothetical protein
LKRGDTEIRLRAIHTILFAAAVLLLAGCEGDARARQPYRLSLATFVAAPAQWNGKRVQVDGELRLFEDQAGGSYGVIEDGEQNRIGLKEIEPWKPLVGREVSAEGTVRFDPAFGWFLEDPEVAQVTK